MKIHSPSTVRTVEGTYEHIYAHAVETRMGDCRQLHISGQLGIDREGNLADSFGGLVKQAMQNVEAILAAASMSKDNIVKACYFVVRAEDLPELNAIRADRWRGVRPAVTTLLVAGLVAPEFLIEIEILAQEESPAGG